LCDGWKGIGRGNINQIKSDSLAITKPFRDPSIFIS
jgi:hypothetical protein